jgi:hypothetical protein
MTRSEKIGAALAIVFWSLVFGSMLVYRAVNQPIIICAKGDLYCLEN